MRHIPRAENNLQEANNLQVIGCTRLVKEKLVRKGNLDLRKAKDDNFPVTSKGAEGEEHKLEAKEHPVKRKHAAVHERDCGGYAQEGCKCACRGSMRTFEKSLPRRQSNPTSHHSKVARMQRKHQDPQPGVAQEQEKKALMSFPKL